MSGIRESIQKIAGKHAEDIVIGEVLSVDKNAMTCEVEITSDDDKIVASLVCGDKNKGLIQVPKIGSIVVVIMMCNSIGFVVMVEEVEEIIINGGSLGGLIKIEELNNNLKSIKDYVEALKDAVNSGISAVGAGSSANGGTGATVFTNAMNGKAIEIKDMEDIIIKH
jgi:hypothetical protein